MQCEVYACSYATYTVYMSNKLQYLKNEVRYEKAVKTIFIYFKSSLKPILSLSTYFFTFSSGY